MWKKIISRRPRKFSEFWFFRRLGIRSPTVIRISVACCFRFDSINFLSNTMLFMHWNNIEKSFLKNLGSESAISTISPSTLVLLFDYFINKHKKFKSLKIPIKAKKYYLC